MFIFLLLKLYESLLYDVKHICRYLHYLLKSYFNNINLDNKVFLNILGDIIQMVELPFDFLDDFLSQKIRSSAVGAFKIHFRDGSSKNFGEINALSQLENFNPNFDVVEIEDTVTCIHVMESNAPAKMFLQDSRIEDAICHKKSLIIFECSGFPDIAIRAFLCHIAKFFPNICFTSDMDCDAFGLRFHKLFKFGSQRSAHFNDRLIVSRIHPIGIMPYQLSAAYGYKHRKLTSDEKAVILSHIKGQMKYFPHLNEYLNDLQTLIWKNCTTSLGGTIVPATNVENLFSFLSSYSKAEQILEPKDGLEYFEHIERIAINNANRSVITDEEIFSLRTDLPNFIMNKAIHILNDSFEIKMRTVNFTVATNTTYRCGDCDDLQIIQLPNFAYILLKYSYQNKEVNIFHLNLLNATEQQYVEQILQNQYGNPKKNFIHYVVNEIASENKYSGIWSVVWTIDLLISKQQQLPERIVENERKLFDWFLNFINRKNEIVAVLDSHLN